MSRKPFVRLAALCAALCLLIGIASAEQAQSAVTLECGIGYGDAVTFLRTVPVTVQITNNGADASGVVQIDVMRDNTLYDIYEAPLSVAGGASARVTIPVELTYKQKDYAVRWVVDGAVAAEARVKPAATIDPSTLLIGVVSDNGKSLSQLDISQNSDPLMRMEYWRTVPLDMGALPSDIGGMDFFDMLVVDGADLSALNDAQKNALQRWIENGGVVIIGGGAQAATAFPYFSRYTGISAGALTDGGDVSKTFTELLKSGEAAMGGSVRLVPLEGASGEGVGGDSRLIDITDMGEGCVITCAFSLSDEPFAKWQGRFALWQRLLVSYKNTVYSRMVDRRSLNNRYAYGSNDYVDYSITSAIDIPNSAGSALPVVLLGAFVLLVGFGGYLLLKRFDRREWMWALVPALAVCFALGMWALSGSLGIRKPVAVYYTVARADTDGAVDTFTGVTVAKADPTRIKLSVDEGYIDPTPGMQYYDQYATVGAEEGKQLQYIIRTGADAGVEMPHKTAWESVSFSVSNAPVRALDVSGECAIDGDGLLFTIRNEGGVSLEPGLIITDYGYARVDALAPGGTLTARLSPPAAPIEQPDNEQLNGLLLTDAQRMRYSYYDFFNSYFSLGKKNAEMSADGNSLQYNLLNSLFSGSGWSVSSGNMHYIAFAKDLCELGLRVDGERVLRASHYDVVDVKLSYNPVASDGTVRFLKGGFPMYEAQVDKLDKPSVATAIRGTYNYFRLEDKPAFAFDMNAVPDGFTLTDFHLSASYAYYSYKVSLYNTLAGQWEQVSAWTYDPATGTGKENVTLTSLEGYIDADGMLYARFERLANTDDYAEVGAPVLTMDGRVE